MTLEQRRDFLLALHAAMLGLACGLERDGHKTRARRWFLAAVYVEQQHDLLECATAFGRAA